MEIIKFISKKIFHPVFAQDLGPDGFGTEVFCYDSTTITPEGPSSLSYFLFLIAPVSAFFLNLKYASNLRNRQFSTLNEIYKAFIKSLILIVVFYFIISVVEYFQGYYPIGFLIDYTDSEKFIIFIFSALMASGLGFLPFGLANLKMLKIFLALILILPALVVFLFILATKIFPPLMQYAPKSPVEIKKEVLANKIREEGIIK